MVVLWMKVFTYRASRPEVSVKKMFLEISQNWQKYICVRVSFLIKLQVSGVQLYQKETLAQVFSCEFYQMFKSTFSYRTFLVGAPAGRKILKFSGIFQSFQNNNFPEHL